MMLTPRTSSFGHLAFLVSPAIDEILYEGTDKTVIFACFDLVERVLLTADRWTTVRSNSRALTGAFGWAGHSQDTHSSVCNVRALLGRATHVVGMFCTPESHVLGWVDQARAQRRKTKTYRINTRTGAVTRVSSTNLE